MRAVPQKCCGLLVILVVMEVEEMYTQEMFRRVRTEAYRGCFPGKKCTSTRYFCEFCDNSEVLPNNSVNYCVRLPKPYLGGTSVSSIAVARTQWNNTRRTNTTKQGNMPGQ